MQVWKSLQMLMTLVKVAAHADDACKVCTIIVTKDYKTVLGNWIHGNKLRWNLNQIVEICYQMKYILKCRPLCHYSVLVTLVCANRHSHNCSLGAVRYRLSIRNASCREISFSHNAFLSYAIIWNFAQSVAISLPYSVQNCKTIEQIKRMLWTNKISRDLNLRWVSDEYPILLLLQAILVTGLLQYWISVRNAS